MKTDAILTISTDPLTVRLHPEAVVRDEWGGAFYMASAPFCPTEVKFGGDVWASAELPRAVSMAEVVRACLASPDRTVGAEAFSTIAALRGATERAPRPAPA